MFAGLFDFNRYITLHKNRWAHIVTGAMCHASSRILSNCSQNQKVIRNLGCLVIVTRLDIKKFKYCHIYYFFGGMQKY